MRPFPALKRSSLVQNAFVLSAKTVRLQHNKRDRLHLDSRRCKTKIKYTNKREIVCVKLHFSCSNGLKKGQKLGRDERQQEDYATSGMYFLYMSGDLLAFIPPSLTETKFSRNVFTYYKYKCTIFQLGDKLNQGCSHWSGQSGFD